MWWMICTAETTPPSMEHMKIGDWVYVCCEHDLEQLTDEARLAEVVEDQEEHIEEFGWELWHVFPTRDEALTAIGRHMTA